MPLWPPIPFVGWWLFVFYLGRERSNRMDGKLYVGNLAFTTTEDDLRVLFAQAGAIHSIDLIKDRDTGQSKGFAFVTMANPSDAAKAIGMFNEFTMQNHELKVNPAKAR